MSVYGYLFWSLVGVVCGLFVLCVVCWLGHVVRDRLRNGKHRPDCACDPCWARHCAWMDRVRDVFIRDQVEATAQDQQGRRP